MIHNADKIRKKASSGVVDAHALASSGKGLAGRFATDKKRCTFVKLGPCKKVARRNIAYITAIHRTTVCFHSGATLRINILSQDDIYPRALTSEIQT